MSQQADGSTIPVPRGEAPARTGFAQLRTELADLAFSLERQGRLDAADIVMQIDGRLRELAGEPTDDPVGAQPADGCSFDLQSGPW